MTGFLYRLAYPIEDQELTTKRILRQALLAFADDAADRGIRLVGEATARIDGEQVVCEADAQPIPGRRVAATDRYGLRIAELAAQGLNDRQISEALGEISGNTVCTVRQRLGIPAADKRGRRQKAA